MSLFSGLPMLSNLLCYFLRIVKICSKPSAFLRPSPYSYGRPHSSSRHTIPYHIDRDSHPGIFRTGTAAPNGSGLIMSLTTHSKIHAVATTAKTHTPPIHQAGKGGFIRISPLGARPQTVHPEPGPYTCSPQTHPQSHLALHWAPVW